MAAVGTAGWRKWLAVGTGIAIEIDGNALNVLVTRVRPRGASILAAHRIENLHERPAGEWGDEYRAFLRKYRLQRQAALVLLPRRDVIVRTVHLPGIADKQLPAAMPYQLEGLHPYAEEEAHPAWTRLGNSPAILTGIARWDLVEHWSTLFAEAGIPLAGFTFSAACIYSALRFHRVPPAEGLLAIHGAGSMVEAYGESPSQPVFSTLLDVAEDRALPLAAGQLRLPPESEALPLSQLLPAPLRGPEGFDANANAVLYAASLAAACPHLAIEANLLPVERRTTTSRLQYVPTAALAGLLLIAGGILVAQQPHEDRKYLELVNAEIAKAERAAARVHELDKATVIARSRIDLLDSFRRRSIEDADALRELTSILAPPAWAQSVVLTRTQVTINGESEQAAPLLKAIDASPLFRNSEFAQSMGRTGSEGGAESFSIRTQREADARPAEAPKPEEAKAESESKVGQAR